MNIEPIFQKIRLEGGRITKVRKETLHFLAQRECLASLAAILAHLKKMGILPNRSTIFRELLYLTQHNIILKNTIAGTDYYEIPCQHHHHLICLRCKQIKKVSACTTLEKQEAAIAKHNHFQILNHSLEFYGYCQKCQAQKI
jgi:Fe2+ or Zn2+ uptake regulation protein